MALEISSSLASYLDNGIRQSPLKPSHLNLLTPPSFVHPNSSSPPQPRLAIIGSGAAGLFTAACMADMGLGSQCFVFEKTRKSGAKILISGGGRCNVTHACFEPQQLVQNYPRGHRELLGPFRRFQCRDTVNWFENHGVELKTEEDGRIFPLSDSSQTIVDCLINTALNDHVTWRYGCAIESIDCQPDHFILHTSDGPFTASHVLIATGSNPKGYELARSLGHTLIPRVPSLFSFHIENFPLVELAGISVDAQLSLKQPSIKQKGRLLITHTGFSGPAALKLSAWAARELHECQYQAPLWVDWLVDEKEEDLYGRLLQAKQLQPHATLASSHIIELPKNLLRLLATEAGFDAHVPLGPQPHAKLRLLAQKLKAWPFTICGQSTHKQEFVTSGGLALQEIDFKRFESKRHPGLFFAGEVLDIDAVTGGFNFQNAWTGGWHVAKAFSNQ